MEEMTPEQLRTVLGENIRRLRRAHVPKITQDQLATAIGVTQGSLSSIEAGKHAAPIDLIAKIAAALGEPPDVLLRDWQADRSRLDEVLMA